MSHILQHLVMPNLTFGVPEEMYVRLNNDKVHAVMSEGRLSFDRGGRVSFDTFFNSFTIGVWKKHTSIKHLQLCLRGNGRFLVRIGLHRVGYAHRWLTEHLVEIDSESECRVNIDDWGKLEHGMLYFALEALEDGELISAFFSTQSEPVRTIKLGVVITHFNRKEWVIPALNRIRRELLEDFNYREAVELVVVDNSRNITLDEAAGVTLIPNQNLGGSGGFTRGLLHLKDQKIFTHCLFMDDDASCEIESIRRTIALIRYSVDDSFAVSGSLMRELEPYRLVEKGAKFNGHVLALKSGLDMRHVQDLLNADYGDAVPDYGAWWFFAFPINAVKMYPFPFFVRGDDIRFGLENQFNICTINGVGCWGDDFELKSSPLTAYLDTRSHLIQGVFDELSLRSIVFMLLRFVVAQLFSYNYASATSVVKAVKDFMAGPKFFIENIDTAAIRADIAKYAGDERLVPIDRAGQQFDYIRPQEGYFRKLARIITLNGFFVPSVFMKTKMLLHPKAFRANFRSIFLYKKIMYEYEPSRLGYMAVHDKNKFFTIGFDFLLVLLKLIVNFQEVKSLYVKQKMRMMSESFWRDIYSK